MSIFSWEGDDLMIPTREGNWADHFVYTATEKLQLKLLETKLLKSKLRAFLKWKSQAKLAIAALQYQKLRAFALKLAKDKKSQHSPGKLKPRPRVEIKTVKPSANEKPEPDDRVEAPAPAVLRDIRINDIKSPSLKHIDKQDTSRGRLRSQSAERNQVHERLYNDLFKKQESKVRRVEVLSKEEMKECTFKPNTRKEEERKLAKTDSKQEIRTDISNPDLKPVKRYTSLPPKQEEQDSKSLFLKLKAGLQSKAAMRNNSRKPRNTDVGTRLYNKAQEIEKKKEIMRKSFEPDYSFTPQIAESTDRWLNVKTIRENRPSLAPEEIAVVSSAAALRFKKTLNTGSVRDFLSPKVEQIIGEFKSPQSRGKPYIP